MPFRIIVCPDCGSTDIVVPATSWWDVQDQTWAWEQTDASLYCHSCDDSVSSVEIRLNIDSKRQTHIPNQILCLSCNRYDKTFDPVPWCILEDYDNGKIDKWERKCRDLPFWAMPKKKRLAGDTYEVECTAYEERTD